MYIYGPVWVHMHHIQIRSQRPEEGIGFHITGVWGSYEPSHMDIRMEPRPSARDEALLTTEPPLHPKSFIFSDSSNILKFKF